MPCSIRKTHAPDPRLRRRRDGNLDTGDYAAAFKTAEQADNLQNAWRATGELTSVEPGLVMVMAMAAFHLGRREEARRLLATAEAVPMKNELVQDADLLREAEALIAPASTQPASTQPGAGSPAAGH